MSLVIFHGSVHFALSSSPRIVQTMPGGYKTYFMLNSPEHAISTPHKIFLLFIMLINVEMPPIAFFFLTETCFVGAQKNHHNETVL